MGRWADPEVVSAPTAGAHRGSRGVLLGPLATGTTVAIGAQLLLPPLLPEIIDRLGISPGPAGLALTLMWALYAVMHYPGGRFSDRYAPVTVIVGGLLVVIAGGALLLVATVYPLFLVGAALLGLGGGLYVPGVYALLPRVFPERVGTVYGVIASSLNLGGALAPGLAVVVIATTAWNAAYLPVIAVLGLVVVGLHRGRTGPYEHGRLALDVGETLGRLFGDPGVRWTVLSIALMTFAWSGFASFLPAFLQAEKGLSPALANAAFAGMYVIGIVINPFTGPVGDRLGYRLVAAALTLVAAVGIGLLVVAPGLPGVALGVGVAAVGLRGVWPVVNAHVVGLFPEATYAGDFGAARTVFLGLGSLGSTYVGLTAEASTYGAAFVGLGGCLVLSLGGWLWLAR